MRSGFSAFTRATMSSMNSLPIVGPTCTSVSWTIARPGRRLREAIDRDADALDRTGESALARPTPLSADADERRGPGEDPRDRLTPLGIVERPIARHAQRQTRTRSLSAERHHEEEEDARATCTRPT